MTFCGFHVLEGVFAHADNVFPVAVVHNVHGKVVDNGCVFLANNLRIEAIIRIQNTHMHCVGTIFSQIGNHIAHTHHATFQRHGAQRGNSFLVAVARFHQLVKLSERVHGTRKKRLLREFAIVAQGAIERLQTDIAAIQLIKDAHGMHVMIEIPPRVAMIYFTQITLARMTKRRMAYIMPQRNRLDKVGV